MVRSHGGFALCLGSALLAALVAARVLHSGRVTYAFLLWNVVLAWIPWLLARASAWAAERGSIAAAWSIGAAWLAFLPNAPYLVTDFVHLRPRAGVPLWYDIALLGTAALTGLMAGGLSLRLMHGWVSERYGALRGLALLAASVVATGVGIYLGRFERWNSWDLVLQPDAVARDLVSIVSAPAAHARMLGVTAVFAALTTLAYFAVGGRIGVGVMQRGARSTSPPTT